MDDKAREAWRNRLRLAYPWLCPICKTARADPAQFVDGEELICHRECGHVIAYRAGSTGQRRDYKYVGPHKFLTPHIKKKER